MKEEALEGSDEVRYAADCASSDAGEAMSRGWLSSCLSGVDTAWNSKM